MVEEERKPRPAGLRRDVSVWGSYMWGFADVGASAFVGLGLVISYAQGAAPLAFTVAALVYVLVGLAYTELASAYPVSGGGQYYAMRGLGDFWGTVAGAGLMLSYVIDISLFAAACAGYVNFFMPVITGRAIDSYVLGLGVLQGLNPVWLGETVFIILLLVWLNIRGIKESSWVNEVVGVVVILMECSLIVGGFLLAWDPAFLVEQWRLEFPTFEKLTYGTSLGIISFVGLESISQAAQETRRPATIIPRTSLALTFTVFLFGVSFAVLAAGMVPWQAIAARTDNPVAVLASAIPLFGPLAGAAAALLGAVILFISSNSGIMSASRLAFSMSQYGALPKWFESVHARHATPVRTIWVFSSLGIAGALCAFLTDKVMHTLGSMYAFGASLGYVLVFLSLVRLRFIDSYAPRPFRMPLNIPLRWRGRRVEFPVLACVGMVAISAIFVKVVWSHPAGRIAGPAWVALWVILYLWFRHRSRLPRIGSVPRKWEEIQMAILVEAEEHDLAEQYRAALAQRQREKKRG